ncbi:hypothetical protein HAX54_027067 [Datura stramonium]|uniref:Uncharacterized protein n=1 Tax=Datura stramonium TaxID=4076 RepID=A0ABS8S8H7_DATST|nr:hypothetical protein [Datura stramonium]
MVGDPFSVDITKLTVGYLEDADKEVVDVLKSKGVNTVPFNLDYTVDSAQGIVSFTMDVDMLAHFDEWQRSNQDDEFEAEDQWPLELGRVPARISAVDYIQAQRGRSKLIHEVKENFKVDAFIETVTGRKFGICGKTTITTGIYAPPDHDHVVLFPIHSKIRIVRVVSTSSISKPEYISVAALMTLDKSDLLFSGILAKVSWLQSSVAGFSIGDGASSVTNHHKQRLSN